MERAHEAAGWKQALTGAHVPDSEEFGVTNSVWRARQPRHPARWKRLIEGDLAGAIRATGYFWLATRMPWARSWQLAGAVERHEAAGQWFSAVPEERWPADPARRVGVMRPLQGE